MLTRDRLKKLFEYIPSTGEFIRKVGVNNFKASSGAVAGGVNAQGYVIISIDNRQYRAHRLAFLYMEGYIPENQVDHINRIKHDNRWSNLREVSQQCNSRNIGNQCNTRSGVKGVGWDKINNKWKAQIMINGKGINLGRFDDFTEAVAHRLAAEQCLEWEGCDNNSPAHQYIQNYLRKEDK